MAACAPQDTVLQNQLDAVGPEAHPCQNEMVYAIDDHGWPVSHHAEPDPDFTGYTKYTHVHEDGTRVVYLEGWGRCYTYGDGFVFD